MKKYILLAIIAGVLSGCTSTSKSYSEEDLTKERAVKNGYEEVKDMPLTKVELITESESEKYTVNGETKKRTITSQELHAVLPYAYDNVSNSLEFLSTNVVVTKGNDEDTVDLWVDSHKRVKGVSRLNLTDDTHSKYLILVEDEDNK